MSKVKGCFLGLGLMVLALMVAGILPAKAEEKPSAEFTLDVMSKYVWRGMACSNDSVVLQPSMTLEYQGISLNFWGNYDSNTSEAGAEWTETDFTLDYTYDKLPYDLSANAGTIYYALDGQDSFEFYAGLSGTCPVTGINAGITIYREISHFPGWWVELSADRSFNLPWHQASLDLGTTALYLNSDDSGSYSERSGKAFSGLVNLDLKASVSVPLTKKITITPQVAYSLALGDDAKYMLSANSSDHHHDHFYGGVGLSFAF